MSPPDKPTRREFMAITSTAALGAAVPVSGAEPAAPVSNSDSVPAAERPYSSQELVATGPRRTFSGDHATQVAMPVGGIGAGCLCVNGYGGVQAFRQHCPVCVAKFLEAHLMTPSAKEVERAWRRQPGMRCARL